MFRVLALDTEGDAQKSCRRNSAQTSADLLSAFIPLRRRECAGARRQTSREYPAQVLSLASQIGSEASEEEARSGWDMDILV